MFCSICTRRNSDKTHRPSLTKQNVLLCTYRKILHEPKQFIGSLNVWGKMMPHSKFFLFSSFVPLIQGMIQETQISRSLRQCFRHVDMNHDGRVDLREFLLGFSFWREHLSCRADKFVFFFTWTRMYRNLRWLPNQVQSAPSLRVDQGEPCLVSCKRSLCFNSAYLLCWPDDLKRLSQSISHYFSLFFYIRKWRWITKCSANDYQNLITNSNARFIHLFPTKNQEIYTVEILLCGGINITWKEVKIWTIVNVASK